ncbi:homoserine O-acetyltransferase [Sphingobacteriaceae bacterium WQ 2009]|uniref:Homoserine O-acetyltransferase n=1 Tax=Rhinopithecimicrobium faecis TaxID=2820698 RepID=A0A8T4HB60_9SPHI|nr:homoserine O-acetyltransferase [Sphingobacteriaceae bacterium WQ 2009]
MSTHIYHHQTEFTLENGQVLSDLSISYHTYGTINAAQDNVIWVCHALTANSDVFEWWEGLFGEQDLFNPREHYIICATIIGSHYGTTNPLSVDPKTGNPYYLSFPQFSIRDLAAAHQLLAEHLAIKRIKTLIGGSLGGQQALEWAAANSIAIDELIIIACNAVHSPWGVALNESQRLAITADRTFYANSPTGGAKGLKAARSIALISYRAYNTYGATQLEDSTEKVADFKAASYQNYQGEKLVKRFNAYSYYFLTKAMDSHNVARGRNSLEEALRSIQVKTLVVGISSDVLFPVEEQKFIANYIPNAAYYEIDSLYGHDGFLIETKQLTKAISQFTATQGITAENIQVTI